MPSTLKRTSGRAPNRQLPAPVRFHALGTTAVVAVTDTRIRDDAATMLALELDAIDHACSPFRVDSELTHVNRAAGHWVAVSRLFLAALDAALDAARATDGLVDPTSGRARRVLRDDGNLTRVERIAGWRSVGVDAASRRVRVPHGVELELGATAKPFAADHAAHRIAAMTGCGVIVNLGGDCAIAGPAPDGGWRIRVTDRGDDSADAPGATIALTEGGLATSGPNRGRSASLWRTVSVAAPTCVDASVASTAAIVLGANAPAFLEARGYPARLVAHDDTVHTLAAWPQTPQDLDPGVLA